MRTTSQQELEDRRQQRIHQMNQRRRKARRKDNLAATFGIVGVILFVLAWLITSLAGLAVSVGVILLFLDLVNLIDVVEFI